MPKHSIIGGLSVEELQTVQEILGQCETLDRAQLFGSRAMNTHRPTSDVDLALFGIALTRNDVNSLKNAFEDSTLPYTFDLIQHETIKEPELLVHIKRRGIDVYRKGFYLSEHGEWIPEGWTNSPLNQVVSDFIDYRGKTPQKTTSGIPLITAKVVKGGRIHQTDEYIAESEYDSWMRRGIPEEGDVILTTEAPLGEVAFIPSGKIALAQRIITLRGKVGSLDNGFLKYSLQSPLMQNRLVARESGSTVSGIKSSELKVAELLHPEDFDEQKAIASVLGSLDDKIELLREQNETLEALAQTLFKRWFIDFNFPDENGNPYKDSGGGMVASELGEIPEGWEVDKLNGYISISGGGTPSTKESSYWDGEIAWSSPKDLSDRPGAFLFETNKTITSEGLGAISSGLNPTGSLLLSSRAPIGYVALADIPVAVNQGYIVFAPEQYFSNQFMFLWLKKYMSVVTNAANGSTFLEISKKAFKEIEAIIPSEEVLRGFQNIALPHFDKIRNNLIQIETLTQLRDALLPKLMKGEIRVPAEQ